MESRNIYIKQTNRRTIMIKLKTILKEATGKLRMRESASDVSVDIVLNKFADRYNGTFNPYSNISGADVKYFDSIEIQPNVRYVFTTSEHEDFVADKTGGEWMFSVDKFGTTGDRRGITRDRKVNTSSVQFSDFLHFLKLHVNDIEKQG